MGNKKDRNRVLVFILIPIILFGISHFGYPGNPSFEWGDGFELSILEMGFDAWDTKEGPEGFVQSDIVHSGNYSMECPYWGYVGHYISPSQTDVYYSFWININELPKGKQYLDFFSIQGEGPDYLTKATIGISRAKINVKLYPGPTIYDSTWKPGIETWYHIVIHINHDSLHGYIHVWITEIEVLNLHELNTSYGGPMGKFVIGHIDSNYAVINWIDDVEIGPEYIGP